MGQAINPKEGVLLGEVLVEVKDNLLHERYFDNPWLAEKTIYELVGIVEQLLVYIEVLSNEGGR